MSQLIKNILILCNTEKEDELLILLRKLQSKGITEGRRREKFRTNVNAKETT